MRIAVIGAGHVGCAIIELLLRNGVSGSSIIATARSESTIEQVKQRFGVETTRDNRYAVEKADIVFLCVKPGTVPQVLSEIRDVVQGKILISTAALVPCSLILQHCACVRLARLIPVLSMPHGQGIFLLYNHSLSNKDVELLGRLLTPARIVTVESEEELDQLTVFLSSGLAFLYTLLNSYARAGLLVGLKLNRARELLSLLLEDLAQLIRVGVSEDEVIEKVATPGGITITGLFEAEQCGLRGCVMRMVYTAWEKARRAREEITRLASSHGGCRG